MQKKSSKMILALLVLAVAMLSCNLPVAKTLPPTVTPTAPLPASPAAPAATATIPPSPTPGQVWTTYQDKDWNFSANIPSLIREKPFLLVQKHEAIPQGPEMLLLLSDSSQSETQISGPDETIRITIIRQKPDEATPFDLWATLMSTRAGKGKLAATQNGSCAQISLSAEKPVQPFEWASANFINAGDYYYGIVAGGKGAYPGEVDKILKSFQPEKCK